MIKLTWGNIHSPDFMTSLHKILAAPADFVNAQKLVLLGREIKKQQKLKEEAHKKVLELFGTKDEKKPGYYNIPDEKQAAYAEEMEKLMKSDFTSRIEKFDAKALSGLTPLSAQDLLLLEPILLPIEEAVEDTEGKVHDIKKNKEADAQPTAH